ncbi:hypothetical protein K4K48_009932 [Colletotrichum sp. SAR 10_66]|nr:hypothetical protein K4K51_011769 [Colletotrichum sp. SAR 10_75]KAJ5004449.1 hypothetical protein K4K48_009932 [Colletotrichum sp. SAR 10_66]
MSVRPTHRLSNEKLADHFCLTQLSQPQPHLHVHVSQRVLSLLSAFRPTVLTRLQAPDNFTIFNFTSATMWFVITQLLTTELSTYPLSRASPAPPSVSPPPAHSLPTVPLTIDQNTVPITASPSAICAVVSNALSVRRKGHSPMFVCCFPKEYLTLAHYSEALEGCLCLSIAEGLFKEGPLHRQGSGYLYAGSGADIVKARPSEPQ